MTPVTFIFQFCDSSVEGMQFVFQFLNFMLNLKSPSGKFPTVGRISGDFLAAASFFNAATEVGGRFWMKRMAP